MGEAPIAFIPLFTWSCEVCVHFSICVCMCVLLLTCCVPMFISIRLHDDSKQDLYLRSDWKCFPIAMVDTFTLNNGFTVQTRLTCEYRFIFLSFQNIETYFTVLIASFNFCDRNVSSQTTPRKKGFISINRAATFFFLLLFLLSCFQLVRSIYYRLRKPF